MNKLEKIADFLSTLKTLHKTGRNAAFTIYCEGCGSKNCQIMFFPEMWKANPDAALGIKCLDCGCAGGVPYDIEDTIYG